MLNFRAAHNNGDSERKIGGENMKATRNFTKSKKNDKSQTKCKINNERKLNKILNMVEQMKGIKFLREEQHECKIEISKFREENGYVRKENE